MSFDLIPFRDAEELAQGAAREWLREVQRRAQKKGPAYCVALSGGRIAGQFLADVAGTVKLTQVSIESVDFFWGDERCVAPDDPESNYAMARRALFEPVGLSERRIHRIRGEIDPEQAAHEASAELGRVAPLVEGQPVLDLIFLGMGGEGHVASLFPGEPEETMASPAVFRPVVTPKPPPRRVTLGYGAIASARQVWLMVAGEGKEAALRESLAGGSATPLGRVLKMRRHTRVLVDSSSVPGFGMGQLYR